MASALTAPVQEPAPPPPDAANDPQPAGTRLSRRAFGALAAGSGIAATVTLALWHFGARESYSTGVGEARMIRLADGSRVQLNTDSEIDVSLQKERRQIRFVKGEARFDVAHDPSRPFWSPPAMARFRRWERSSTCASARILPS
jgi:transmembrane sensor